MENWHIINCNEISLFSIILANTSPLPRMGSHGRTVKKASLSSGRSLRWVVPTLAAALSHPLARTVHTNTQTSSLPSTPCTSPPSISVTSHLSTLHTSSPNTRVISHSTQSISHHSNTHSKPMAMLTTPQGTRLMARRREPGKGGTRGVILLMMGKTRKELGNSRSPGKWERSWRPWPPPTPPGKICFLSNVFCLLYGWLICFLISWMAILYFFVCTCRFAHTSVYICIHSMKKSSYWL